MEREVVRGGHGALAVAYCAIGREKLSGFERAVTIEHNIMV